MALLARQSWRLIQNPNSLCARVIKSKYYPNGDMLNCELKKRSSYVWQSIWAGIQTFKKACIWRVGDGEKSIYGTTARFQAVHLGKLLQLGVIKLRQGFMN